MSVRKRTANQARVVISVEVELSPEVMAAAPNYRRYGPYIVADLLCDTDADQVMSTLRDTDGFTVLESHIECAG